MSNGREAPDAALALPNGSVSLPAFLPDATRGVVRGVDASDLEACGVQALMMNVFHLMQRPGSTTVRALGGLHGMSGWRRPIVTDSGGFQALSVLRERRASGSVSDRGIDVRRESDGRRFRLTPEKCVELQLAYGADVVTCLDDCTHPDDPPERQRLAVDRTLEWARASRRAFEGRGPESGARLFAVIQGGTDPELRKRCAAELIELGFDGYGFGGWPLDASGALLVDTLAYTRELVPRAAPLHALGVGHPENVATCASLGYDLCDSSLPTRDARRGRLYAWRADPGALDPSGGRGWLELRHVGDERHRKASEPVSQYCDAPCCARYGLGYLHHLRELEDALYVRLATLHNLRFMTTLMEALRRHP